jgi:hypothetical protein
MIATFHPIRFQIGQVCMRRIRKVRSLQAIAFSATLLATSLAPMAAPAHAAAICGSLISPFHFTNKLTRASLVLPDNRHLETRSGTPATGTGTYGGYAWITSSKSGEYIWIDYSENSHKDWVQCGLQAMSSTGPNYSRARSKAASSSVCIRAGYRYGGISYVTSWWC